MSRADFRQAVLMRHLAPDAAPVESDEVLTFQETGAAEAATDPVSYAVRNGVAVLTIDNPPVNSLHPRVLKGLLEKYQRAAADASVVAVVVTGKPGTFVAGADIAFMKGALESGSRTEMDNLLQVSNNVSAAFESGPKPTVAAIDGTALGGGLELAMMCNGRVATPKSTLGLPELRLGLIPGFGGTQRLPRLVGLQQGLRMMLQSKNLDGNAALEAGLVDEVASSAELIDRAIARARSIASGEVPKQRSLYKTDKLEPAEMAAAIFQFARDAVAKQPVAFPSHCLDAVQAGVERGGEDGLLEEQRQFARCIQAPTARALMHVFFASRATGKVPGVTDTALTPRPMKAFAVLGGGLMGAGIVTSLLVNGATAVLLKEVNQKFLDDGVERVKSNLSRLVKSKRLTEEKMAACLQRLRPVLGYEEFRSVDMVIEAVIENLELKQKVFADLEAACRPDCVLATNTSTISLELIGAKTKSQDRIVGLHFFTPAHIMPLLEIVRTKAVSAQVVADALAVAKLMRKTPIVVGNCTGFAVNRIFFPYGMAADLLIMAGANPYHIDKLLAKFGVPMGVYRMADLVGGDVVSFVNANFRASYGDRTYESPLRAAMIEAKLFGEKTKKGFYVHGGGKPAENPELQTLLAKARAAAGVPQVALSDEDTVLALLLPVVNEACRVVAEEIVIRPSDVDIATIFGYGFPAWRGGLLYWADAELGSRAVCAKLEEFARRFQSAVFAPCEYIRQRAATNTPLSAEIPSAAAAAPAAAAAGASRDDDIVIVTARRTALGRARRGSFKDTRPEDLLAAVIKEVLESTRINPSLVGDLVVGTVLPKGEGAALDFRAAGLLAGLPQERAPNTPCGTFSWLSELSLSLSPCCLCVCFRVALPL